MKDSVALITGANGGIGRSLCQTFSRRGWRVIATDLGDAAGWEVDSYISLDLNRFAIDGDYRDRSIERLRADLPAGLHCLVNNAAYQYVAPMAELSVENWHSSLNVNVTSPFLLVRGLLDSLQLAGGSVVNIGSVHARLTKPQFVAYATSKAALEGLTRALAVEIGASVRVNAIAPAAIATPMLEAGFDDALTGLANLGSYHPSNCIGNPEDVAETAWFLANSRSPFLNGTVLGLDGGIASRLHDPL